MSCLVNVVNVDAHSSSPRLKKACLTRDLFRDQPAQTSSGNWNGITLIPTQLGVSVTKQFFSCSLCVCALCMCVFHSSLSLVRNTPPLLLCATIPQLPRDPGTVECGDVPYPPLGVSEGGSLCDAISSAMLDAWPGAFRLASCPAAWISCLPGVVFCHSLSRWTRAGIGG